MLSYLYYAIIVTCPYTPYEGLKCEPVSIVDADKQPYYFRTIDDCMVWASRQLAPLYISQPKSITCERVANEGQKIMRLDY